MQNRSRKPIVIILVAALAVLTAVGAIVGIIVSKRNNGQEVTIAFVTNGGKEIAPVTLKKGEELTLPTAEKEGRVFADWYYDEGFTSVCPKVITAKKTKPFMPVTGRF